MAKIKLEIVRELQIEEFHKIKIESCTAYYNGTNEVIVVGEISALSIDKDYVEVHVIIYDDAGDIMSRQYTNWGSFGLRQSFEIECDISDFDCKPIKVKVFPSKQ